MGGAQEEDALGRSIVGHCPLLKAFLQAEIRPQTGPLQGVFGPLPQQQFEVDKGDTNNGTRRQAGGLQKCRIGKFDGSLAVEDNQSIRTHSENGVELNIALFQRGSGAFYVRDIDTVADDIATGSALFDDQQPATIVNLAFVHLTICTLVPGNPARDPLLESSGGFSEVTAQRTRAHHFLKGFPGHYEVGFGAVKAPVGFVADHQAILAIVDRESLRKAGDRFMQQLLLPLRLGTCVFQFDRPFGHQLLGAQRTRAHQQQKGAEYRHQHGPTGQRGPDIPAAVGKFVMVPGGDGIPPVPVTESEILGVTGYAERCCRTFRVQQLLVRLGVQILQEIGKVLVGQTLQGALHQLAHPQYG